MVTLKDVADIACVSVSTVSAVLSGKAEKRRIARDTQIRIMETARQLGFQHNAHARALRTGRSNLIAIVGTQLNFPIPAKAMHCTTKALRERSYGVVLYNVAEQEDGDTSLTHLENQSVAGLFLISYLSKGSTLLRRFIERGIPIVAFDDWGIPGVDVVTVDREEGAYQATQHLLSLGHQRIALTVGRDTKSTTLKARIRGYERAHVEAGVPVDDSLFLDPGEDESALKRGYDIVPRVLAHPAHPTAVFCQNDHLAMGALRRVYEEGRRVPEDLALVGFDGLIETEYTVVPLTTVVQPIEDVAEAAIELLMDGLSNNASNASPRRVVIPARLAVRQSSQSSAIR